LATLESNLLNFLFFLENQIIIFSLFLHVNVKNKKYIKNIILIYFQIKNNTEYVFFFYKGKKLIYFKNENQPARTHHVRNLNKTRLQKMTRFKQSEHYKV
jgi:hypothetical protein